MALLGCSTLQGLNLTQQVITSSTEEKFIFYSIDFFSLGEDYPEWNPESESAPHLSIRDAVAIAKKETKENLKLKGDWKPHEVHLRKMSIGARWFYVVTLGHTVEDTEEAKLEEADLVYSSTTELIEIPVYLNGQIPDRHIK